MEKNLKEPKLSTSNFGIQKKNAKEQSLLLRLYTQKSNFQINTLLLT